MLSLLFHDILGVLQHLLLPKIKEVRRVCVEFECLFPIVPRIEMKTSSCQKTDELPTKSNIPNTYQLAVLHQGIKKLFKSIVYFFSHTGIPMYLSGTFLLTWLLKNFSLTFRPGKNLHDQGINEPQQQEN